MKKSLVALFVLSSALTSVAQAKETLALTCAFEKGQDTAEMNGYLVWEGVRFSHGQPETTVTVHTLENGKIVESNEVLPTIFEADESQISDVPGLKGILKKAGIKLSKAKSAKFATIDSSSMILNVFDENNEMLTGAILASEDAVTASGSEDGIVRMCYPTTN